MQLVDVTDTHAFAAVPGRLPDLEPAPGLAARLGLEGALPQEPFDRVTRMVAAELGVARSALVLHEAGTASGGTERRNGTGTGAVDREPGSAEDLAGIVLSYHGPPGAAGAGPGGSAAALLEP